MLRAGVKVGSLDLDGRQATLSHYLDNRMVYAEAHGLHLPMPRHARLAPGADHDADEAELNRLVTEVSDGAQVLVIDTPGADTPLSRAGHALADTLLTPLNDSFIDLAVLAKIDRASMSVGGPSHYAEMVWDIKKRRAMADGGSIRWLVMRNRLGHVEHARNRLEMERLLTELARRIGFQMVPGLGERVIYRELFLKGLTLLDLKDENVDIRMGLSHVAARQELRHLLQAIGVTLEA